MNEQFVSKTQQELSPISLPQQEPFQVELASPYDHIRLTTLMDPYNHGGFDLMTKASIFKRGQQLGPERHSYLNGGPINVFQPDEVCVYIYYFEEVADDLIEFTSAIVTRTGYERQGLASTLLRYTPDIVRLISGLYTAPFLNHEVHHVVRLNSKTRAGEENDWTKKRVSTSYVQESPNKYRKRIL